MATRRTAGSPEDEAKNAETTRQLEASVPPQAKPSLHTKLVAVLGSLEGMEPEGRNSHFKYDYWTADQVSAKFRALFVRHGLSFMADVVDWDIREGKTAKGGSTWLTTLRVLFSITDTVTGERISGHGIGQGDDPNDKGSNKAMAGALKYWLLKTFLLGGEDAEADEEADRRSSGEERSRDVRVGDSDVRGVQKGGRSTTATDPQVTRFRQLSRDNNLNAIGAAQVVADVTGEGNEIVADEQIEPEEAGPLLIKYVTRMPAEDLGRVIQYLEMMLDNNEQAAQEEERAQQDAHLGDE